MPFTLLDHEHAFGACPLQQSLWFLQQVSCWLFYLSLFRRGITGREGLKTPAFSFYSYHFFVHRGPEIRSLDKGTLVQANFELRSRFIVSVYCTSPPRAFLLLLLRLLPFATVTHSIILSCFCFQSRICFCSLPLRQCGVACSLFHWMSRLTSLWSRRISRKPLLFL